MAHISPGSAWRPAAFTATETVEQNGGDVRAFAFLG
jgi:hypothetical protein